MLNYNAPIDGAKSSIDSANSDQMNTFYWLRKALIETRDQQFFMPLADVTNLPKHYGKKIKSYHYMPLLDDRNVNDQGIDANGVTIANGNLYGSSKDIGKITDNLPELTENGGRVNRVGFTRQEIEGSIYKFGFFYEFTNESMIFDSDDGLKEHLSREMMNGATKISEDTLQRDLILAAGTILFAGAATSNATITGEGATPSVVSYANLQRLDKILTQHKTPKQTRIITGSLKTDTKVIGSTRVAYCGPDVVSLLRVMKDPFDNPAFIPVQHYGDAANLLNGEVGSVGPFRFIEVPNMLQWSGAGATATAANPGYQTSTVGAEEKYNVYPILVVGGESFTTIGFQTDGKTVKFDLITKMPGRETADRNEPYGETGFSSLKWYYGILIKRPERLGLIKTVAPL